MTDTDNTDDFAPLGNTIAEAKFLLHNLKQDSADIGIKVNTNKKSAGGFFSFKTYLLCGVRPRSGQAVLPCDI